MFGILAARLRVRAAIAMIAAYAFCALAPHVALALTNGTVAMHCLDELTAAQADHDHTAMSAAAAMNHGHDRIMAVHQHDSGATPQHSADGKSHPGDCCGVFCMSALANAGGVTIGLRATRMSEFYSPAIRLAGDDPDLPNRPPNV
jgi:hypothetical protein